MSGHKFQSLENFLKAHKRKDGQPCTHTRIPNKEFNVYGGSWYISKEDMTQFRKLYTRHIFVKNKPEYLTEKQDEENGGPILIDLDFRYKKSIKKRQHNDEFIFDIIDLYATKINELFDLRKCKTSIPMYVFEKPSVNNTEKVTKDGIHIIIGINAMHNAQQVLRNLVVKNIGDILSNIPIQNTVEDVVDPCISTGKTNWQLYGSKKPGGESYQLTKTFEIEVDINDDECSYILSECEDNCIDMSNFEKVKRFSPSYDKYITLPISDNFKEEIANLTKKKKEKKQRRITNQKISETNKTVSLDYKNLVSVEAVDEEISNLFEISYDNYLKDNYDYLMILDEEYYGSYENWKKIGWILKNTAERNIYSNYHYFLFYVKFSSKWKDFEFSSVPKMWKEWQTTPKNGGLTVNTLYYYCKQPKFKKQYDIIFEKSTDKLIEDTLDKSDQGIRNLGKEVPIAKLSYKLYGDQHVCAEIKKSVWFSYESHRWHLTDSGYKLRKQLEKDLLKLYITKEQKIMQKLREKNSNLTQKEEEHCVAKSVKLINVSSKLNDTNTRNKIMQECKTYFYIEKFMDKLDTNPYLLGFENGVYDFEEGRFRMGKPEDYISLSTGNNYVEIDYDNDEHVTIVNELNTFMTQLFPDESLRQYMWEHLASSLLGTNLNQTFNIYIGSGANGKSVLVRFMELVLGDYKGTVPISLITSKRVAIGGTSSEVYALRGKRYACMNEPNEDTKINTGIMKEITGGDPIQARELHMPSITYTPMFNLVVCTNHLFKIESSDDGTWRRIRLVEFESKFCENPSSNPADKEFPRDNEIHKKFEKWVPIFTSMLIEIAKKTKGKVNDCDKVTKVSDQYRKDQDFIAQFVSLKIEKGSSSDIMYKTDIQSEFKLWYEQEFNQKAPSNKKLTDHLNKKFGKFKKCNGRFAWRGLKIIHIYDDEPEEGYE